MDRQAGRQAGRQGSNASIRSRGISSQESAYQVEGCFLIQYRGTLSDGVLGSFRQGLRSG